MVMVMASMMRWMIVSSPQETVPWITSDVPMTMATEYRISLVSNSAIGELPKGNSTTPVVIPGRSHGRTMEDISLVPVGLM